MAGHASLQLDACENGRRSNARRRQENPHEMTYKQLEEMAPRLYNN
jgi:hypothetical protein